MSILGIRFYSVKDA